jgi:signal transduction histidine kinase
MLYAALEACPLCFATVAAGRISYANPPFVKMLGFCHRAEIEGRPLTDFLAEVSGPTPAGVQTRENTPPIQDAGGRPRFPSGELVMARSDGTRIPIRIAGADAGANEQNLMVLTASAAPRDQSRAQQFPPESERLATLGRVASGVAHDFNNLLTGILLYCDLLLTGMSNGSPFSGYVREIRRAGEQSATLIRQLLALARNQTPEPGAMSWEVVISEMHNLLTRLIGENIELITEFAPDGGEVRMDTGRMRQVLLNLVLNARDAMPEGGRIVLAVKNYQDVSGALPGGLGGVELSVTDTGCGMDSATRSRVFQPFFTTKNNGHGNGLGLATVHRLVEESHGRIEIRSQPGEGTRVSIQLPRVILAGSPERFEHRRLEPNER